MFALSFARQRPLRGRRVGLQFPISAGKPRMVIVAAVMRKLLHQIYGVLRSGQRFDPTHA